MIIIFIILYLVVIIIFTTIFGNSEKAVNIGSWIFGIMTTLLFLCLGVSKTSSTSKSKVVKKEERLDDDIDYAIKRLKKENKKKSKLES